MQSIVNTIQSGEESGKKDTKLPTELLNEIINAGQAKKEGDTLTQEASILRAGLAGEKAAIDAKKQGVEQFIKHKEDMAKMREELRRSTEANKRIDAYLKAVDEKDWQTADAIAAILKDVIVESLYTKLMDYRQIMASANPETLLSAFHGAADEVQEGIYLDENQETHDALTQEQLDQRDRVRGKELTPEQRGRVNRRAQFENMTPLEVYEMWRSGKNPFEGQMTPQELLEEDVKKTPARTPETESDKISARNAAIDALEKPANMTDEQWTAQKNQWKAEVAGGSTVQPSLKTPSMSSLEEKLQEIETNPEKFGLTNPDGSVNQRAKQEALRKLLGIDGSDPTDFENTQVTLDKYAEIDVETGLMLDTVSGLLTKDARQAYVGSMNRILKGRTFEEMDKYPRLKQAAAKLSIHRIMDKAPGGEIVKRHLRTMELLRVHLPEIMKTIDDLRSRDVDLGRVSAIKEWAAGKIFANVDNPEVSALNTRIKDLIAAFVALRSGAQVTEQERKMYTDIFSQIGRGYEFNKATIEGLMTNVLVELNSTYKQYMHDKWGGYAAKIQFEPGEVAPIRWVAPTYITEAEFEKRFSRISQSSNMTREEYREGLRIRNILVR